MNLEACYIYKDIVENKDTVSKNKDLSKLYSATIPYSLETIRINNNFPNSFYTKHKKQYTNVIVNVRFDKPYYQWDETQERVTRNGQVKQGVKKIVATNKKIRKYLYVNGFILNGIKYVFYKRGAGKAKNGYAFFIQEHMKDYLVNRSRLNISFSKNEKVDLTSLLAYESLVSSGIEFTITLDPKTEILLIDDINGQKFKSMASITKEVDGCIHTSNEQIEIQNCITDGQALLDESIFKQYNKKDKGFMLLRTDMFKSCAFNTKLSKWFKENNITELRDMFGNKYDSTKVKLITTPNSLKFLKFSHKVTGGTKSDGYNYWRNNIDNVFGVVKCDKEGNFGSHNRTTYQLLNSIPNLTYEELLEITKLERDYVMLLKNDSSVFKHYLGYDLKKTQEVMEGLENDNLVIDENKDLLTALLMVNSDVQYTKKFKKMRSDLIANYIKNLKRGKIRLADTKYVTLFSNPYEMLLASIGKFNNTSIMKGREIYCSAYDKNQDFCASRNPHINAGNVMYTTNRYHEEYKWFNFTDNICAINFFDNDAPQRLQGADTDSDTFLLIPNHILTKKALYCEKNFPTPINMIEGSSKKMKYNMSELQKLDIILSNNYIGKIVNMSQIINSYMNDAITKKESKEVMQELYNASSKLSSMSQIEIDKSKKSFDNIDISKEISKIKENAYIRYVLEDDKYGDKVKKMVVPKFFKNVSDFNEYRVFERFETPLDILQDVLTFHGAKRMKGEKHKEFYDLLVDGKEFKGKVSQNSVVAIHKVIETYGKRVNGLKVKSCKLSEEAKKTVKRKINRECIAKLKKLKPSDISILYVLQQCFGNNNLDVFGFKKYSIFALSLLFNSKKKQVLKCFKNKNVDDEDVLIKIKTKSDIEIFGSKYQKTKINKSDFLF
jgi:hypothetical protein